MEIETWIPQWIPTKNPKFVQFKCRHCNRIQNCPADTERTLFLNGFCKPKCRIEFNGTPLPTKAELKALKEKKYVDFYESIAWLEMRYLVLKIQGRVCACCRTTEGVMQVDHIKPRIKFPELALVFSNLQVLCKDCNLGKGFSDETDWRTPENRSIINKSY